LTRIIVGFPPGGSVDTTARLLAEVWRKRTGDNVIVENRPGAAGRIAINAVKNAPADGRTVLVTPDSMLTIYPSVYTKLDYDPAADLTSVSPVCKLTFALGIGPSVPDRVKSLDDLVSWYKETGQPFQYGVPATGSKPHFIADLFGRAAGLSGKVVAYRGGQPALQDLLGGHIPCVAAPLGEFIPHVDSGRLRMLAVSDLQRSPLLPKVGTFAEHGWPSVVGADTFGVFLPRNAPAAIVARTLEIIQQAVSTPNVVEALLRLGLQPESVAPAIYAQQLAREREAWAPIVQASGFRIDE
jgi:tripartite-type tricarboxylate transporter receptor subunit TctC